MSERDGYIPGVPCWIDTNRADPGPALRFYEGLFGWAFEDVMPDDADGHYFIGRIRGGDVAGVGTAPEGDPGTPVWNTYIWVDSADEAVARARAAGGQAMDPFDVLESGRMAVVIDPEGAAFCVWEPKRHRGAKVVNEHGSLNFNTLATRDLERAEAFYGAVFGWRALPLASGVMWALPGYGDHLEEATPGLRQQMDAMDAPEGFIDVVAAVEPILADDTTTPARWSVTFGVDDADETAARAKDLGGEVVLGPVDAPWTRMAVIRDPQGVDFVISQFVPENKDLAA